MRCKGEVDEGRWEGTMQADAIVAVHMLLEWLTQLSPPLLHEGADAILSGKEPQIIIPMLSDSVLKSLTLMIDTLNKLASKSQKDQQFTDMYSAFAKALIPFPKTKTVDSDLLLNSIAFLRDVKL